MGLGEFAREEVVTYILFRGEDLPTNKYTYETREVITKKSYVVHEVGEDTFSDTYIAEYEGLNESAILEAFPMLYDYVSGGRA